MRVLENIYTSKRNILGPFQKILKPKGLQLGTWQSLIQRGHYHFDD